MLVIGPNGAGKSTLLKTMFGLLKAHRGAHRARRPGDRQPAPHEIKRLGISYVPQELNTFPQLTVEENLKVGGWTLRREPARLKQRIARRSTRSSRCWPSGGATRPAP